MSVQKLPSHLHFVGIGGAGMSAVASVLASRGYRISGSDRAANTLTDQLAQRGATIHIGHAAEHIGDAEAVVVSTAIAPDNPEIVEAKRRGVAIWHRARALACILDASEGIGIAGTHGKTTTTSMAAMALDRAGVDPTVLIGGELADYGSNAKVGQGSHTVAEVDESDGSLVEMHPRWAIVLNLDMDHLDHYRDEAHLIETFRQFLGQVSPEGGAVIWHDDARLARLRAEAACPFWSYSATDESADYHLADLATTEDGTAFTLVSREAGRLIDVQLHVPGTHNALNAASVMALCHRLGLDLAQAAAGLRDFRGTKRRFQLKGTARGVTVVDDYAHHPTEIRATLEAARSVHPDARLVAVFQPHRFSRTQHLWRDFAAALSAGADMVVLTDIYSAGEAPIEGVDSGLIRDAMGAECALCPTLSAVVDHLRQRVRRGDLVMTLGAGNVWQVGEALLGELNSAEERVSA